MRRAMRRRQEVSVVMKKIVLFSILLLPALPAVAEEIDRTIDAGAKGRVDIYNTAGSVKVEGWDTNKVRVTGRLGQEVDEFKFERNGDTVTVEVKAKKGRSGGHNFSSDIVVQVPRDSSIEVATVSADIDVKGVRGEQELQAVSGDIETQAFDRDIEAESVSGDIDVRGDGKAAECDLVSVSGDIFAENLGGSIDFESVSGDVVIAGGSFDRVDAETVNGDIEFKGVLRKGGKFDAETVNGSVDIDFVGNVSAEFRIETFNGRIRNCFGPEAQRVSKYAPGWELNFTEGGGEGRVSVETLNGGVTFCKE